MVLCIYKHIPNAGVAVRLEERGEEGAQKGGEGGRARQGRAVGLRLRPPVPLLTPVAESPPRLHRGKLPPFRGPGGEQVRVHQNLPGIHRPIRAAARNHDRRNRHFRKNPRKVHHQGSQKRTRQQSLQADSSGKVKALK